MSNLTCVPEVARNKENESLIFRMFFLPANPAWNKSVLKLNLKFLTLTPSLAQRINNISNGAAARTVNVVLMICGGLRSGSLNMCLISGLTPRTGVKGVEALVEPTFSSRTARDQRRGFEMTASPRISSTLYLPFVIPSSFDFTPTS